MFFQFGSCDLSFSAGVYSACVETPDSCVITSVLSCCWKLSRSVTLEDEGEMMRLEESADGGVMRLEGGAELMELGRVGAG